MVISLFRTPVVLQKSGAYEFMWVLATPTPATLTGASPIASASGNATAAATATPTPQAAARLHRSPTFCRAAGGLLDRSLNVQATASTGSITSGQEILIANAIHTYRHRQNTGYCT